MQDEIISSRDRIVWLSYFMCINKILLLLQCIKMAATNQYPLLISTMARDANLPANLSHVYTSEGCGAQHRAKIAKIAENGVCFLPCPRGRISLWLELRPREPHLPFYIVHLLCICRRVWYMRIVKCAVGRLLCQAPPGPNLDCVSDR